MASAINDWKDLIAENIYDILIELHFPHEMALRMKNEMSNGLLSFISSANFDLLKKNNVYKLNTILTLLKHTTNTQKFNQISFNYIGTDYDNLFFQKETALKPELAPIKVHLEEKTKEFDHKKKAVKRKAFQELSNNVPEIQKQPILKDKLQQLDEVYNVIKKMSRSSSDSSLASLSSTPDKPKSNPSKMNQANLMETKSNQYSDENQSSLKNSSALNYIMHMKQVQQMRIESEQNIRTLKHQEPENRQHKDVNQSNLDLLNEEKSLALNYIKHLKQIQQIRTESKQNIRILKPQEPEHKQHNDVNQSNSNLISFQQYVSKLTQSGRFKTEPEKIEKQPKESINFSMKIKETELTRKEYKNMLNQAELKKEQDLDQFNEENAESDTSIEPEMRYLSEEGLIPLPEYSFQVEQILNDKNQCLKNLKLIAKETIDFYTEHNFIINSKDYRRIAQALLNKYHILNYMVIKQVDLDYIRLRSRVRANPWTLISKQLSAEFRRLKSSQRKNQVKDSNDEIHFQTSDTESF